MFSSRFTSWSTIFSAAFLLWACGASDGTRCPIGETGCSGGNPNPSPVVIEQAVPTPGVTGPLSCTLTIDKSETPALEERTLTVTGSGGLAPYHVDGVDFGIFSVSSIYKVKYPNTETVKKYYTSKIRLVDNRGVAVNCQVSVAVLPQTGSTPTTPTNPSGLACNLKISSSNLNPRVGESVQFLAEASNGAGAYVWDNFAAGNGYSYVPTPEAPNKARVSAAYNRAGSYLAVIPLSNTVNGVTSRTDCRVVVPVRQPTMTFSPSGSLSAISEISFWAETAGFDPVNPPTFASLLSDDTNLEATITPEQGTGRARVVIKRRVATDKLERLASIRITASNSTSGDSVQLTKDIKFLSTDFRCDVQVTGNLYINSDIHVRVSSPEVSDLRIDSITNSPDGTANFYNWSSWNDILARYPTVGTKVVKFKAYSPSRGNAYCNNGAFFEQSIEIKSHLAACSVTTTPNLSALGQIVNVQGAIQTNDLTGSFNVSVTTVGGNSVPYGSAIGLNQALVFNDIGRFEVKMKVRDSFGTEVNCSTFHTVIGRHGIWVDGFTLWDHDRGFALTASWDFLPGYSSWFRSNYQSKVFTDGFASTIDIPRTESNSPPFAAIGKAQWFALVYHGSILIQEPGCYQFQIGSDDGAILLLDGAVLDAEGISTTNFSGLTGYRYGTSRQVCFNSAQLGLHRFVLKYYNGPQGAYGLNLRWSTPSNPNFATIPAWHYIQAW